MMRRMNFRHRTLRAYATLLAVAMPLVLPALARASQDVDEKSLLEGRLDGYYPVTVRLDPGSTGLTWLLLMALGVLTIVVLFKDSKRSHLD